MINLSVRTTTKRYNDVIPAETTIGEILDKYGITLTVGQTNANGTVLTDDDLALSASEFANGDDLKIFNVAKHDNNC